ncbi:MAG: 30S ribosomal protein S9 [Candidatus Buchananbacteria bacterium]
MVKAEKKVKEPIVEKKRVRHSYLFAVGRRKKSIARVRLIKSGEGKITVNDKDYDKYFPTFELAENLRQPLEAVGKQKDFNFSIKVAGGGARGQAEAARHGIARALLIFDKDLKPTLKPLGYLKRDPRRKERKKPGLKKARRGPQWAKR